jgi:alpha-beta hydrolase superfamily lysophospholipase
MIEEAWSAEGLHGTLLQAANRARRGPAVLIVAGSGPTDRDGNGPGLSTDTYKMLAEGFAAQGISVLRYDKRGVGDSRALTAREENVRFSDFVGDAVAAARSLSARADVSSVVIAGHSEGALIALLAAQQIDVAGVILLAATGRPLSAVLRDQLQTALPDVLRQDAFAILDKLTAGEHVAEVRPELNPLFRPSVQPFLMSILGIDPAVEIAKVRQPVLLMHAARDLQIAQSDLAALRKARPDMRIVVLPDANHVLKTSPADRAGNLAMYSDRTAPLDPDVMPPLVDFVRGITK